MKVCRVNTGPRADRKADPRAGERAGRSRSVCCAGSEDRIEAIGEPVEGLYFAVVASAVDLTCAECGLSPRPGEAWRILFADKVAREAFIFCPYRAEREFGEPDYVP